MADQYAVVGNPVEHSKSPLIHRQFALQTGEDIEYGKILAPLDRFEKTVEDFFAQGGKGLNVTVPFKLAAFDWAQQQNPRAVYAGAANTLIAREHGKVVCDNTDGIGLVRDLQQNHHVELKGKNILLLGAGGAVQGVLQPIMEQQPQSVFIANRTPAKAVALAKRFASETCTLAAGGFADIPAKNFAVVINGTAASLSDSVPPLDAELIHPDCCCYDMMYASEGTAFTRWAQQQGAQQVYDGWGMLVEQAAESFYLWRGIRPETGEVIRLLR